MAEACRSRCRRCARLLGRLPATTRLPPAPHRRQVRAYAKVFWERYAEINDHEKVGACVRLRWWWCRGARARLFSAARRHACRRHDPTAPALACRPPLHP